MEKHVSKGSVSPHPNGRGPSVPKISWDHLPTSKRFDLQRRNLL